MPADLTFRPRREEDLPAIAAAFALAFHAAVDVDGLARRSSLLPAERTAMAFDGDLLVGTSGAYPHRLSVPGGELPCAGVTIVTVRPTHRRRGILREMMRRLLEQAVAEREPLAALWASEGGIYGRFGYGVAAEDTRFELAAGTAPIRRPDGAARPTIELHGADAVDVGELGAVWERARTRRGGMPARSRDWWTIRILGAVPHDPPDALPKRVALARGADGAPLGYAVHSARSHGIRASLHVAELVAAEPEAEAALWEYLRSVDLVDEVIAPHRPVDDPLPHRLADFEAVRVTALEHALWLRVLDVPAAVAGRAWAAPLDLALELSDPDVPENAGTWRLECGREGEARATRTDRAADLALDAAALGAIYLGGSTPARLADAGRIAERTPGALEALGAALHVARAPWTPEIF